MKPDKTPMLMFTVTRLNLGLSSDRASKVVTTGSVIGGTQLWIVSDEKKNP